MGHTLQIHHRFCGPPRSGNGGYSCGLIAKAGEGLQEVRLKVPPPLDTPLQLVRDQDVLKLFDDDTLVAECRPAEWSMDLPRHSPKLEEARLAAKGFTGFKEHLLPTCFVCGPEREPGDGLRIFAGPSETEPDLFLSPWIPTEDLADSTGAVATEFLWAALDCPGYFAVREEAKFALLGSFSAKVLGAAKPGDTLIAMAWAMGQDGRKHFAGSALLDADGECIAQAKATWIAVPPDKFV